MAWNDGLNPQSPAYAIAASGHPRVRILAGPGTGKSFAMKRRVAGVVHKLPPDLKKALTADKAALAQWEDITPLARNEWICWVESVKTPQIRQQHVERAVADLKGGKRRPCCWMGCVHRKDKPLSASQKFLIGKRSKKK